MDLSRLQSEVSNGTYVFKRPLKIINCSCIIFSSDDDGDDDDDAMQMVHSMSNDDMHATVDFVDIIQDRTEALLNQQSFDTTLKEACVLYVCNEATLWMDASVTRNRVQFG